MKLVFRFLPLIERRLGQPLAAAALALGGRSDPGHLHVLGAHVGAVVGRGDVRQVAVPAVQAALGKAKNVLLKKCGKLV